MGVAASQTDTLRTFQRADKSEERGSREAAAYLRSLCALAKCGVRAYATRPHGRVDFFSDVGRGRIDRRGAEERDELAPTQIEERSVAFSIAGAARFRVRS